VAFESSEIREERERERERERKKKQREILELQLLY
jgi:hypothetical protein